MVKERALTLYASYKQFIPALSFLAGFLWDSITLGAGIEASDLWILGVYYVVTTIVVMALTFEVQWRWSDKLPLVLQFLNGSLFSALVVFYFKSTHTIGAYVSVLVLLGILIANEFWQSRYTRREFIWAIYCLCATMFLNFLIPHLFGSISTVWFLLSMVLGIAPVLFLVKRLRVPHTTLRLPGSVLVVLTILYFAELIPPVPLVLKDQVICREHSLKGGEYSCMVQEPTLFERLGLSSPKIVLPQGEKVWCLSSVFAPQSVKTTLEHRWYRFDEKNDEWIQVDGISFPMKGGRKSGWRFYSGKSHWTPGWWKVAVAVKGGAVVGYTKFHIVKGALQESQRYVLP